jgi:hypothetical protein
LGCANPASGTRRVKTRHRRARPGDLDQERSAFLSEMPGTRPGMTEYSGRLRLIVLHPILILAEHN